MRQLRRTRGLGLCLWLIGTAAACSDCDPQFTRLAPKIEVDVCATDYVADCSLDFGVVPITYERTLDVMVSNPTSIDLIFTRIELTEDSDPAFSLPADLPEMVLAANTAPIPVSFRPTVESQVGATLLIYSDAVNVGVDEPVTVVITGGGDNLGQPDLEISPPQCAFGDVGVGATAFCDLSVANRGQLDLIIDEVGFEGGTDLDVFQPASVLPVPVYLPSQAGVTVSIACTPAGATDFTGTLYFNTNDPDTAHAQVPLTCTGAAVPTAVARVLSVNGETVTGEVPQVMPLDDVVLTGADSQVGTPGRTIVAYSWVLQSKPTESTVVLTSPTAVETAFSFNSSGADRRGLDVAGTYVVRLTVTDSESLQSTNDARVTLNAVPGEDLHVQVTWDHGDADIDLHLVRNNGFPYTDEDCYYANCKGANGLDWGGGGGNPHLDVDDIDGFGPENINIAQPNNGTYQVAVHYYAPHSGTVEVGINVKIFVRGGLRGEYTRQLTACNQYWAVADVEWPSSFVNPVNTIRMETHSPACY